MAATDVHGDKLVDAVATTVLDLPEASNQVNNLTIIAAAGAGRRPARPT